VNFPFICRNIPAAPAYGVYISQLIRHCGSYQDFLSTKGKTTIYNSYTQAKDRVTRISLKTGGELRCSGKIGSSCSTSDTHRVNLVANPVISHQRGKDREVFTTSGTYPWSSNFPFICRNIPAAPAYGVYISQLIRHCGSYQDFLDIGLMLTRKLLNKWSL
jgi:hypothetical protein